MNLTDLRAMKCKTCGEPLDINLAQNGVIKCAICDSCFTLPKDTADKKVLDFLSQGEHDLDTGKFDDAYSAFSKACELDKTEPEAYWGMALAEFKIQYLKDEVNNRLQPICHEISDKEFADSSYFLKALRYATEAQKTEYERKAEEINYIKNEFYKIAQSGAKYDCFICVKVSDENGGRTQDYKAADDIYFELKGKGYKPFFSERELVGVTGADYEARILYALKSSECMLVVCLDEAYLRTKWVKNEYSRFLKLVNDEEKESDSIALVFGDRPIEKLPGKKGKIQGIALNSLTAMERIVSFVDSHTPAARMRREEALRQKEEEAKRRAQEDEAQRRKFAEQEERLRQQEERFKQLEEMLRAQQEATRKAEEERKRKDAEEKERLKAEKKEQKAELKEQKKQDNQEEKADKKEEISQPEPVINPADFEIVNGVLKKYKGNATEVIIPDGVTEIGKDAFKDKHELKKLIIPDGVTVIGESAFSFCDGLTSITIPNSVTSIGKSAFFNCKSLARIKIPGSVTNIGDFVFLDCGRLERITVDADNPSYMSEDNCLLTKDGKTLIRFGKNSTLPKGITNIGNCAFSGLGLTNIEIPDGVTDICGNAFYYCKKLTTVTIPQSVKSINNYAFHSCNKLTEINLPKLFEDNIAELFKSSGADLSKIKITYTGSVPNTESAPKQSVPAPQPAPKPAPKSAVIKPVAKRIAAIRGDNGDFEIRSGVLTKYKGEATEVVIPDKVTNIGKSAFSHCDKIKKIVIPNGVRNIFDCAFDGCKELTTIVLPQNLKSIGYMAFYDCGKLSNITFPRGMTSIDMNAFMYCYSLKSVIIPINVMFMGSGVFYGIDDLTIYCRTGKKPLNWDDNWDRKVKKLFGGKHNVVWGYKGE